MGLKAIWKENATMLVVLIVLNMMLSALNETAWGILGVVLLLGGMYLCYRQGMALGHAACGVSANVADAKAAGDKVYAQLDAGYLSGMWRRETAVRALLVSAAIPLAAGVAYIVLSLAKAGTPAIVARVAAWVLSLPYWPLIMRWHEDFVTLTPAIVALLLVSPFVLPVCTFLGYMRGPKLWQRTEEAMKQGRRRAKARARVGKKLAPRQQKPEI